MTSDLLFIRVLRCFRMMSLPAEPPAIDWAFYKKNIGVPGMVESFQKQVTCVLQATARDETRFLLNRLLSSIQYEALKVPYPPDTTSAAIKERETKTVRISTCSMFYSFSISRFFSLSFLRRFKCSSLLRKPRRKLRS